jgi:hypothetical protein
LSRQLARASASGLPDVAALLREIPAAPFTAEREHRLNRQYFTLARDDRLCEAFARKFESTPEDVDWVTWTPNALDCVSTQIGKGRRFDPAPGHLDSPPYGHVTLDKR